MVECMVQTDGQTDGWVDEEQLSELVHFKIRRLFTLPLFLRAGIMCVTHPGVISTLEEPASTTPHPAPRPFPGEATGRGFLDGCVTS